MVDAGLGAGIIGRRLGVLTLEAAVLVEEEAGCAADGMMTRRWITYPRG